MAKRRTRSTIYKAKRHLSKQHREAISKGLLKHYRGRGYRIVRRITKKDRQSVNDNKPGGYKPKAVILKRTQDGFLTTVRNAFKNKRLAVSQMRDYRRIKSRMRRKSLTLSQAKGYRRRTKIRRLLSKIF